MVPAGADNLEPDHPHHVLPQIIGPAAGFGFGNLLGFEFADLAHRLT